MTMKEIIKKFVTYAQKFDKTAPNKHWYVGITQQEPISKRKKQHENEKNILCMHFISLIAVKNKNDALHIEKELEKNGFAIHAGDLQIVEETASTQDKEFHIYIYLAKERKINIPPHR